MPTPYGRVGTLSRESLPTAHASASPLSHLVGLIGPGQLRLSAETEDQRHQVLGGFRGHGAHPCQPDRLRSPPRS
jgi:hypothetical protein